MIRLILTVFILLFLSISFSQNNYTLSGYILDESSEEVIIGANVIIPELNTGTISNSYGFYSITISEGNYEVFVLDDGVFR